MVSASQADFSLGLLEGRKDNYLLLSLRWEKRKDTALSPLGGTRCHSTYLSVQTSEDTQPDTDPPSWDSVPSPAYSDIFP